VTYISWQFTLSSERGYGKEWFCTKRRAWRTQEALRQTYGTRYWSDVLLQKWKGRRDLIFYVSKVKTVFFWNEKLRGVFLTWQLYRQSLTKPPYCYTLFGLNVCFILNLIYYLTVRRRVIFEKLVFSQKFRDYLSFETSYCIIAFIKPQYWLLSWARWIQSASLHFIYFNTVFPYV
jgi:hypothetical protein